MKQYYEELLEYSLQYKDSL